MKSLANPQQFPLYRIGEKALDSLKTDSHGRILAAFSEAIYLEGLYDNLLWLINDKIPMHRRAIQIHGDLPKVARDSTFSVNGQRLVLGPDIDLDLVPASIWISPRPNLGQLPPFEDLADRLAIITRLIDDFPPPTGFGRLLLEDTKIGFSRRIPFESLNDGLALKHARPALDEIVSASITNNFTRILCISTDLIGLGEGLTPSGDDFIGGLLFSSFVLQDIYPQYKGFSTSDVTSFVLNSRNRTNLISYILLKDLASGHTFDTLHRFVNAILSDQHLEDAQYLGLALIRIGHSTGWDLLAGVWMSILLAVCSRSAPSIGVSAFESNSY